MLFSNESLTIIDSDLLTNQIVGVVIGEFDKGRKVFLPLHGGLGEGFEDDICGFRPDLTLGFSRSGRLRIEKKWDNELFVILSSRRGQACRGDGYIETPLFQENELMIRGNGADGQIESWDVVVLRAKDGDVFRVVWEGYEYGYPATFYVMLDSQIFCVEQPQIGKLYEDLDYEMPFTLVLDEGEYVINPDEWKVV